MWIDLEVLSVTQWARGEPTTVMPWLSVGSTHFDEGTVQPDGSIIYDLLNLWLQFEIRVPRRCKAIEFEASFKRTFNDDSWIVPQVYRWSLGTAAAPGTGIPFKWDVPNKTSGLLSAETELPAGTSWLWLTFNYAGQSGGYVAEVAMESLRGDAYGPGRVFNSNEEPRVGIPHIAIEGELRPCQTYVCKGGVWMPTG